MTITISSPGRLTDGELLTRVHGLARDEREATATLVAHLAELDERRLYLNEGYSSLFIYCTRALHYSEGAAYNRIEAARSGRDFPAIFAMLSAGEIHLTAVRLLRPHLTHANHRELLERARHKSRREVEALIAEIRPLPDVPTAVRKLPVRGASAVALPVRSAGDQALPPESDPAHSPASIGTPDTTRRPAILAPLSPDRYKIQFTASRAMYERLQELRDLLRHRIPDGDPAQILDEALIALLEKLKKQKIAAVKRPRAPRAAKSAAGAPQGERATVPEHSETPRCESAVRHGATRHIPALVKREVWARDGGRCAFCSPAGRRCEARGRLEFHHLEPFSFGGAATVDNIALRCAAHNKHEAESTLGQAVIERVLRLRRIQVRQRRGDRVAVRPRAG